MRRPNPAASPIGHGYASHSTKNGFSLLEVVLALTIFFGAIAVLSQVTWNGTRAAVQSQLKAQALFRCETKVQEVVSGIEPLSDQSDVPFEDDSAWVWSLTVLPTDIPSLILVEVTVAKNGSSALGSASLKLRRWMRDPEALIQAMEEQAALQGDQSSVTTDSSSSSGSSP